MLTSKNKVAVQVPHRISGFFEIVDDLYGQIIIDPIKIGSRGAGFNLDGLGKTLVSFKELEKGEQSTCSIFINHERLDQKAETTYFIFNYLKNLIQNPVKVMIEHSFDLPVGCGYGASGAGALGAVYGLTKLFNLNLSILDVGRIAHIAEVVNKTGLGTVCGQLGGGMCILKEPGYPCKSIPINVPSSLNVICGTIGRIETKSILSDKKLSAKIKEAGNQALQKLLISPNYMNFIKVSQDFVREIQILDILDLKVIKELLNDLNNLNIIGASMNQLGRSVYCFCEEDNKDKVLEILDSFKPEIKIFELRVNKEKAFEEF